MFTILYFDWIVVSDGITCRHAINAKTENKCKDPVTCFNKHNARFLCSRHGQVQGTANVTDDLKDACAFASEFSKKMNQKVSCAIHTIHTIIDKTIVLLLVVVVVVLRESQFDRRIRAQTNCRCLPFSYRRKCNVIIYVRRKIFPNFNSKLHNLTIRSILVCLLTVTSQAHVLTLTKELRPRKYYHSCCTHCQNISSRKPLLKRYHVFLIESFEC
jgi:hypothetical protein